LTKNPIITYSIEWECGTFVFFYTSTQKYSSYFSFNIKCLLECLLWIVSTKIDQWMSKNRIILELDCILSEIHEKITIILIKYVQLGPIILKIVYCAIQQNLHNIGYNWHFLSCIINIQFLCNPNQLIKKKFIFGELVHLIFMIIDWKTLVMNFLILIA